MAEGERKRLRKRSALARLPAHRVCFLGSEWQGNTPSWKLTLGTAGKFALPCIQVALICRAMPALPGPLKTHSFTLPDFSLRTCSTLPLLKRTFSRQSLARKKISSVPCPCVFLAHFCGSVSCLENRRTI